MKTKILLLVLLIAAFFSCKKKEDDIPPNSTTSSNYIDIQPGNRGRLLNLSKDGLRMVVWNPYSDTILVYNTFDGSLRSTIVHAHHYPSGYLQSVQITSDGARVISQQDNYEIKLWDADDGVYIRDLETVWGWLPLPDGNSIIGFADNLSTESVIKQVSIALGTTINTDTFPELIFPGIVGTRDGGNQYILVQYLTDLNDPLNPTKRVRIIVRDLISHDSISEYTTSKYGYFGSVIPNDDSYYFSMVTYDSAHSQNNIEFFDLITGSWYSSTTFIQNYTRSKGQVTAGPGTDRFVTIANDGLSMGHIIFQPGVVDSPNRYMVNDFTHFGFQQVDVDHDHSHVAASYETTDGKIHIAVWPAFN